MKKDVPLCINFLTKKTPYKGPGADSEEKHEPVSDIDTAAADGLKVLDPKRPIREADMSCCLSDVRFRPQAGPMHRSKQHLYSITSLARAKDVDAARRSLRIPI